MPSILNTPAAEIPIHFFCLPIAQREILLVNVLTDPVLYKRILTSALYHDDPVFPQTITLFCNYVLIHQMFACLAIPRLPVQITKAFDPTLSAACSTVLILLVDRGLDRLLGTLPRDHLANILRTVILSLSEEQCRAYYGSEEMAEEVLQQPEGRVLQPRTANPHSPRPARHSSPTNSLSSTDTAINPLPQLARRTNLFPRCSRATPPLSPREQYCSDATPAQRGRGRISRRGTPGVGSGPVMLPGGLEVVVESGTNHNPIVIPDTPEPSNPTAIRCFQCQSLDHIHPHCPEYVCPFC